MANVLKVEKPTVSGLDFDRWAKIAVATNYLESAEESASNALRAGIDANREAKEREGKLPSGQWRDSQQDLLRSALIFSCAGLDAALKELVRVCVPLAVTNPSVSDGFRKYVLRSMESAASDRPSSTLIDALLAESPRQHLLKRYVAELTGGSLQSVKALASTASAIGIERSAVRKRIANSKALQAAFSARNQMVHEMDLLHPHDERQKKGVARRRRMRRLGEIKEWSSEVLSVGHLMVAEASSVVRTSVPSGGGSSPLSE